RLLLWSLHLALPRLLALLLLLRRRLLLHLLWRDLLSLLSWRARSPIVTQIIQKFFQLWITCHRHAVLIRDLVAIDLGNALRVRLLIQVRQLMVVHQLRRRNDSDGSLRPESR